VCHISIINIIILLQIRTWYVVPGTVILLLIYACMHAISQNRKHEIAIIQIKSASLGWLLGELRSALTNRFACW